MGRPSHTGDMQQIAPEKVPSRAPSIAGACLSAGVTLYGRWLHTVCPRCTLPLHGTTHMSLILVLMAPAADPGGLHRQAISHEGHAADGSRNVP